MVNYDERNFDALTGLLTDDVHFSCRTDTGTTEYEEFVRADATGRDAVMGWQIDHRLNSLYPLRHNCSNIHVVAENGEEASFRSYILVTAIEGGVVVQSTTLVSGRVRRDGEALLLAELEVVLDTKESVLFRDR